MELATQILAIIQTLAHIYEMELEALPPDKRAEVASIRADDLKRWHDRLEKIQVLLDTKAKP